MSRHTGTTAGGTVAGSSITFGLGFTYDLGETCETCDATEARCARWASRCCVGCSHTWGSRLRYRKKAS